MTDDHMSIKAKIENNMAAFKKISEDHEAYLKQKADILEEAKKLGLDPDTDIPWDQLSESQKRDLERIKIEAEREMKEILGESRSVPRSNTPRGIPV